MNYNQRPSFIPKTPATQVVGKPRKTSPSMTIVDFGTLLIFIVTLVAAAGVFGYERYLEGNIAEKRAALAAAQESFNPALIEELKAFDTRLKLAATLVEQHVAFSQLFRELEKRTPVNSQFESFSYTREGDGNLTITIEGRARDFNTVTLQSQELSETKFLRDPRFSNLDLDQRGNVQFSVTAGVMPFAILYAQQPQFAAPLFEATETSADAAEADRATSTATSTPTQGATTTPSDASGTQDTQQGS